jgi:transcriptional regulator GlxA family with amidase domain
MEIVAANLDRKLQLTALAGRQRLLPEQLSRRFHSAIGLPFSSYLVWSRLERLARLLSVGDPLAVAARAAGLGGAARALEVLRRFIGDLADDVESIDWTAGDA